MSDGCLKMTLWCVCLQGMELRRNLLGMRIRVNGLGMEGKLSLVGGHRRVIHWE